MNWVSGLLLVFVISLSLSSATLAAPVKLDPTGKQAVLDLTEHSGQTITAYVLSPGNETQFVTLRVQGPKGISISAKSILLGSAKELDLINKSSGWSTASIVSLNGSESQALILGPKENKKVSVKRSLSTNFYCGNSTAADLDELILTLQETQGITYTRDQICAEYGYPVEGPDNSDGSEGEGVTPTPSGSITETVQVLVRKNTCEVKANAVYLVRFDFNISGISPGDLSQAAKIYIGATPIKYLGSKASSLKPVSDGQFSPRPLFLMATTGGSSEKFRLVKWNKNKVSLKTLQIVATANWRGHSLIRVLADSVLKGGRGVAEVQSELGVYSVCFKLTRTRQKYNGYS